MTTYSSGVATTDSELIARTLNGCNEAFGDLVRRHQDRLYNAVVHIVGCPSDAEDVLQDAFILALTKLSTFQGQSSFFTWIYRLTVNCALSHRRRKRPLRDSDWPTDRCSDEIPDRGETPLDRVLREETKELLVAALGRMDDYYRVVLVLREIDQLDYAAIADILDIELGTVRSRLHRARLQLRDLLQNRGSPQPRRMISA